MECQWLLFFNSSNYFLSLNKSGFCSLSLTMCTQMYLTMIMIFLFSLYKFWPTTELNLLLFLKNSFWAIYYCLLLFYLFHLFILCIICIVAFIQPIFCLIYVIFSYISDLTCVVLYFIYANMILLRFQSQNSGVSPGHYQLMLEKQRNIL